MEMDKRYIAKCWIEEWATEKDVAEMVMRLAEAGYEAKVEVGPSGFTRILKIRVWEDDIDTIKIVICAACCKTVKGKMARTVFGFVINPEVA